MRTITVIRYVRENRWAVYGEFRRIEAESATVLNAFLDVALPKGADTPGLQQLHISDAIAIYQWTFNA